MCKIRLLITEGHEAAIALRLKGAGGRRVSDRLSPADVVPRLAVEVERSGERSCLCHTHVGLSVDYGIRRGGVVGGVGVGRAADAGRVADGTAGAGVNIEHDLEDG